MKSLILSLLAAATLGVAGCKSTQRDDVKLSDESETWFSRVDANDDGVIDKDEMRTNLDAIVDEQDIAKAWYQTYVFFVIWDTDDNRVVTRREYKTFHSDMGKDSFKEEDLLSERDITDIVDEMFELCDANNDGKLSPRESHSVVDADDEKLEEMGKMADVGMYTKEAYREVLRTMLDMD